MPRTKPVTATVSKVPAPELKKSRSAKVIFMDEKKKEHGTLPEKELKKKLGDLWKALDAEQKKKYAALARCEKGTGTKAKKDPSAPKQPANAFLLFSKDQRLAVKEKHPDFSAGQISKELGEMWRALSAEDKQVYETKSDEDKQRYKNELAEYQAKVTAMATEE